MVKSIGLATIIIAATIAMAACGGSSNYSRGPTATPPAGRTPAASSFDPADFQATVDNPLYPLVPNSAWVYEGEEENDSGENVQVRDEIKVLPSTDTIGGVEVTVVEDKAYEDGELVESTLDYFAQHKDGSVYYFGERVDEYENGQVVGHDGSWLAGEGDNLPGIFLPATPALNMTFDQERAPGVAEDHSTIVGLDQTVTVPAGTYNGCVKTEDVDPLANATEHKYYCPVVGFVREETPPNGHLDLVSFQ
jgi:hypothetical protein